MSQRGPRPFSFYFSPRFFPACPSGAFRGQRLHHPRGLVCARLGDARQWQPGALVSVEATFQMTYDHLRSLAAAGIRARSVCLLVTAERTFDSDGWLRLPSDERMSTLITPTGLPIEGGVQGAVSPRAGYGFRTPLDLFAAQRLQRVAVDRPRPPSGSHVIVEPEEPLETYRRASFHLEAKLPTISRRGSIACGWITASWSGRVLQSGRRIVCQAAVLSEASRRIASLLAADSGQRPACFRQVGGRFHNPT